MEIAETYLAVDTSAPVSVAIVEIRSRSNNSADIDFTTYAEINGDNSRRHTEDLIPSISKVLSQAQMTKSDIDAIVVGRGPGPFTGLRVGIAAARSLSFAWSKPLYGLMSLEALAYDVCKSNPLLAQFIVTSDARRKELYWAQYEERGKSGKSSDAESTESFSHMIANPQVRVTSPSEIPKNIKVFGCGVSLYPDNFHEENSQQYISYEKIRASCLAKAAFIRQRQGEDLTDVSPLYLRDSDAKIPASQSLL